MAFHLPGRPSAGGDLTGVMMMSTGCAGGGGGGYDTNRVSRCCIQIVYPWVTNSTLI